MEDNKKAGSPRVWQYCPAELLQLIFRMLDTESLIRCIYVCPSWTSEALYTVEKKCLWQEVVNKFLVDKGQMAKQKSMSILSWKDVFRNAMQWAHCDKAEISVLNKFAANAATNVHIYKDNLIIVSSTGVKYFNITKSEFIRDVKMECIDFMESDIMLLKLTVTNNVQVLHLYPKSNVDDFNIAESNERTVNEVLHYRLSDKGCHIVDARGFLTHYVIDKQDWIVLLQSRYYGSPEDNAYLHIFQNQYYLLLKSGRVMVAAKHGGFGTKMVLGNYPHLEPEHTKFIKMFHKFGVICEVPMDRAFNFFHLFTNFNGDKTMVLCPGLTCATEHGEMLFIGYSNGKIDFYMPREPKPHRNKKIQYDVTPLSNFDDNSIMSIDVYEETEKHHVFAATRSQVYHLVLQHTNMNDYLWSEYPQKLSMLSDKGCYIVDARGFLTHYVIDKLLLQSRYYGSPDDNAYLHIFQNQYYLLLKSGRVMVAAKHGSFGTKMFIGNYPHLEPQRTKFIKMFHKFGVICEVPMDRAFNFFLLFANFNGDKAFMVLCPGLTCATEHGEMLFIGYSNGKIDFYMPREPKPHRNKKIQYDVTPLSNFDDNSIISIDVYEETEKHHVFAATRSQVYHLVLQHTNMNDYLWSEYPQKLSMFVDR